MTQNPTKTKSQSHYTPKWAYMVLVYNHTGLELLTLRTGYNTLTEAENYAKLLASNQDAAGCEIVDEYDRVHARYGRPELFRR